MGDHRLLRRFRVALALCILLAGLSLALLSNDRDGFGWAVLNELALFAAAGVAVPFSYELFLRDAEREGFLRELTAALDARDGTAGLTVHARGRPAPAEKTAFIAGTRTEIIEVGVTLRSLAGLFISRPEHDFTDPVRQLLRRGVHITCLVADPESPLLVAYADSIGDPGIPARAAEAARQLSGARHHPRRPPST